MKISRTSAEDFALSQVATLKDALVTITHNHKGSVVVVDEHNRYIGVASDGDIRRAMVGGATEFTPVEKFVNTQGLFLKDTATDTDIAALFSAHPEITMIPLLNEDNTIAQVAVKTKE